MNPYLVLNVALDADDTMIRKAYLEAIKSASPETRPKRFQALNEAYEKIRNEPNRLRHLLFDQTIPGDSPIQTLLRAAAYQRPKPPSYETMMEVLRTLAGKN